ncbi:SAM-dependent methyltransferase [Inhella inkyongensis]|uniref:SAM-dependent methyltransferase n=1 Tax=Inhella inkyongensis TaxID=392593 RepID=A0A840S7R0_9BURK|nr:class I SAM-dependent methyltransferase [Inhella inkyongensis]MBB5204824.1 SAM-dependent methyltransferase [Inhella inkyongensis]
MSSADGLRAAFGPNLTGLFSAKVADYVASRPDYPAALLDWLRQQSLPHARVVDLGAGTGLLTQGLLATGWPVLAVEPDAAMRAACDARLSHLPGYRSAAGQAEALPCADQSVDLICAAQCFHWFDLPAARREFDRVLAPGALVALIWNDRIEDDPLNQALDEVFARFGGAKRASQLNQDERAEVPGFLRGAVQHWDGPHQQQLDWAGLLALAFSRSYMPARTAPAGQAAEQALQAVFAQHAQDGKLQLRYLTCAYLGN